MGSESGTQLSNFMADNNGLPSVVLLDEFDHCDPETWEGFYHIFDDGMLGSNNLQRREREEREREEEKK